MPETPKINFLRINWISTPVECLCALTVKAFVCYNCLQCLDVMFTGGSAKRRENICIYNFLPTIDTPTGINLKGHSECDCFRKEINMWLSCNKVIEWCRSEKLSCGLNRYKKKQTYNWLKCFHRNRNHHTNFIWCFNKNQYADFRFAFFWS